MTQPAKDKIEMSCACGKLRGHGLNITPKTGRHLVCMCKDCQAFARYLGRDGDILDQNGGTEIFQITPSQIRLETGLEHLAVTRLGPKGAMRWYASCCNTPIANTTPSAGFPFAGVFCKFINPREDAVRDAALGPINDRFYARDGYGNLPEDAQNTISIAGILKTILWIGRNKLAGRASPSPFFQDDKSPVCEPTILTKEERAKFTLTPAT
jgi:hypothetical protein